MNKRPFFKQFVHYIMLLHRIYLYRKAYQDLNRHKTKLQQTTYKMKKLNLCEVSPCQQNKHDTTVPDCIPQVISPPLTPSSLQPCPTTKNSIMERLVAVCVRYCRL